MRKILLKFLTIETIETSTADIEHTSEVTRTLTAERSSMAKDWLEDPVLLQAHQDIPLSTSELVELV